MRTLTLLAGVIACLFVRTGQADDAPIPAFESLSEIGMSAGKGGLWHVRIFKDGSGCISWGNSPMDFARFPAKTFDFEQIYRAVVPTAKPGNDYTDSFSMALRQDNDANVSMYHFETGELVLGIFGTAMRNCRNPRRMVELRQKHPLVEPRAPAKVCRTASAEFAFGRRQTPLISSHEHERNEQVVV